MTKKTSHGNLEDEETTTDGEEVKDARKSANTNDLVKSGESNDEEVKDEDDAEEKDETMPEPLAPNRLRRANAGSKMHELMNSATSADEFYESAYGGGFKEDDVDDFMPADNSDDDDVDSDFDHPEVEDAEADVYAVGEDEDAALRRTERQQLLAKNRKWAVARFNKCTVSENVCDVKTQRERLEEAKKTEAFNIASLKRFEAFELERRKRQTKPLQKRALVRPIVSLVSCGKTGRRVLIVPEVQQFEPPAKREYHVCAISGRAARYTDPLTGLNYADSSAFRKIRSTYRMYIQSLDDFSDTAVMNETVNNGKNVESMDTSSVQFVTPDPTM